MLLRFLVHAGAVVLDFDEDGIQPFQIPPGDDDPSLPVSGNGLVGIDQEVRDDLFKLLKVSLDGRQVAVDVTVQAGDGFSDLRAHDDQNALDDFCDLNGLFLHRFIGPGEFLQARDDAFDPLGGNLELFDDLTHVRGDFHVADALVPPVGMGGAVAGQDRFDHVPHLLQQGNVVGDEADGVVDLVGDAGHHFAQGAQLVGLHHLLQAELPLTADAPVLGDVPPGADHIIAGTAARVNEAPVIGKPSIGAVGGLEPVLALAGASVDGRLDFGKGPSAVVGMDVILPESGFCREPAWIVAGDFGDGVADEGNPEMAIGAAGVGDDGQ